MSVIFSSYSPEHCQNNIFKFSSGRWEWKAYLKDSLHCKVVQINILQFDLNKSIYSNENKSDFLLQTWKYSLIAIKKGEKKLSFL